VGFKLFFLTLYDVRGFYKVLNLLGNEIAILVSEDNPMDSYQVRFEAKGITSGVYFYRLSVAGKNGNYSETKKMVLLR